MLYSIESIREDIAVLSGDDGSRITLPLRQLPPQAATGDVVEQLPDGSFCPLPQTTRLRAARAMALFRKFGRR